MSEGRFLWLLIGGSFVLRCVGVLALRNIQVSDAVTYDRLARQLAAGGGYVLSGRPSAWWPIGYPAWLSLVYRIAGATPVAGELANVLLSSATVALTYVLVRRIDRRAARLASATMAVFPSHVLACNLLTTETLCTTLWLGAVVVLWPPLRTGWAAVGGILMGLATLVRPGLLLFAPAWLLAVWCLRPRAQLTIPAALVCVFSMFLTLVPWAARNWNVLGSPVLVSTNGGYILWVGNNALATGRYLLADGTHSFTYAQHDPEVNHEASEVVQDAAYRRRAFAFMRQQPWTVVRLGLAKLRYLWATDNDAVSWLIDGLRYPDSGLRVILYFSFHGAALAAYWTVIASVAVGLWIGFRRRQLGAAWLLLVPVIFLTTIHLVFFGDDRFHFPAMPYAIGFAACALTWPTDAEGQLERAHRRLTM